MLAGSSPCSPRLKPKTVSFRNILSLLEELRSEGKISIIEPQYKMDTRKFKSEEYCESNMISFREKDIVSFILKAIQGHTASFISEATHDFLWRSAKMGEEIPLHTAYAYLIEVPSEPGILWANEIVERRLAYEAT